MRAAVTGTSGCIGRALVRELLGNGPVTALFRHPDEFSAACRQLGCGVVHGDLDDESALALLVRDVDVVYHCAARMAKRDLEASLSVNVEGTERLARAALAAGVRRFVYVSSVSVYSASRRPDGTYTEADEPQDTASLNVYAYTKYLGELRVRDLGRRLGLPFTIIRPTNVYGPWSKPWFRQFEKMLSWMPFALGRLPIDIVYVDDLVRALVRAGEAEAAANETFHIGHETVELHEFIERVGRVVGKTRRPLPRALDYAVRAIVEKTYRATTRTAMSMSILRRACYPHTKAERVFGYQPRVALDEGFAAIARWYRNGHGG